MKECVHMGRKGSSYRIFDQFITPTLTLAQTLTLTLILTLCGQVFLLRIQLTNQWLNLLWKRQIICEGIAIQDLEHSVYTRFRIK